MRRAEQTRNKPLMSKTLAANAARLMPYANKAFSLIQSDRSAALDELPSELLFPDETVPVPPVMIEDHMLDRITGTYTSSSIDRELAPFRRQTIRHVGIVRRRAGPAFVFRRGVAIPGVTLNRRGALGHNSILTEPVRHLQHAHYCMGVWAYDYFGHWLRDATTCALLADDGAPPILLCPVAWPHAREYLDLLGIEAPEGPNFLVEELQIYRDFGQTRDKARRYAILRDRLRRAVGGQAGEHGKAYLRRGRLGARRALSNADEVETWFAKAGFAILDVENMSVRDLAAAMLDAQIVVAMEGSHINHAHFMLRDGGCLLVLNPCDRFNSTHAHVADAMGLRTGMIVLERADDGDYRLDPADLDSFFRRFGDQLA